jgi:hypothetical protein
LAEKRQNAIKTSTSRPLPVGLKSEPKWQTSFSGNVEKLHLGVQAKILFKEL